MTDTDQAAAGSPATTAARLADLRDRYHEAVTASGEAAIAKQHAKGKKTARERIEQLLDHGTFVELDEFVRHRTHAFGMEAKRPYGDAVVTGMGEIHGRQVAVYSQDFTIFGGSLGEVAGEKIIKVMEHALKTGVPIIGILDSGGARIQEGVVALGKYGEIFRRNTAASGVIPQISIVMGPAAGGAVYSPALTDFVIMVDKTSQMFVTGPDVIKTVTGEDVGMEELGGAFTHNTRSGVAHYLAADEDDALDYARTLIGYLPDNNMTDAPAYATTAEVEVTDADRRLNTLIPDSPNQPYDVHEVIETLVDDGEFLETQPLYSPEHRRRVRPHRGPDHRHRREPAELHGGHAEHRRGREGRPVRAVLRLVLASRSSPSSTCPATCPAPTRSGPASSAAARSCSTPTPRRPCRSSP